MCGRFTQLSRPQRYAEMFGITTELLLAPRYNVAPSTDILACRISPEGDKELIPLHWGLIPSWSKGPDSRFSMINARAETVAFKPAYRSPFQLTLGLDRDSKLISHLFDERDPAVKKMLSMAIAAAHKKDKYIGICGQGPSDYPDFAKWLLDQGNSSISLNPDTVTRSWLPLAKQQGSATDMQALKVDTNPFVV